MKRWIMIGICLIAATTLAADKPKPKTPVAELQENVASLRSEVEDLKAEVKSLRAQIDALVKGTPAGKAEAAKIADQDAIKGAIREHRLVPGMTKEQASQAIGAPARLTGERADGTKVYEFFIAGRSEGLTRFSPRTYIAIFRNDVLDSYSARDE